MRVRGWLRAPTFHLTSHCSVPQPPAHTWFTPLYPDAQRKVTPIDIEAGLMTVFTPVGEVHPGLQGARGMAVPSGATYTIDLEMHGTLVPTG